MQKVVSSAFEAINEYVDAEYQDGLKNMDIPILMPYCRPLEVTDSEKAKVLLQL